MEYNYTAIVLKKREIGETDRLYTFYTLESGKIQAVGKGVRKPRAKLAGHLETLNRTDIIVARRHGLGNIAGAIAEREHAAAKARADVLAKVLETVGAFERLVDTEERDVELFLLLQEYLETADRLAQEGTLAEVRLVSQGFLFKLLEALGYRAEMRRCAVSGEPLSAERRYAFSPDAGGAVGVEFVGRVRQAVPLDGNAIKLIRIFFQNRVSSLPRLRADEKTLLQVERASKAFLVWISQ
jgi:DNA repair protein RecO (recombination protein O)